MTTNTIKGITLTSKAVEEFKRGRKLHFVPLIYCGKDAPDEYVEKFNRYWKQVENQISVLELQLGKVRKIYHELIPASGEDGIKAIRELNDKSYQIVKNRMEKGAQIEATEESELLAEWMDWSRCLSVGLQSHKVFANIHDSYIEVNKRRNEYITRQIDGTLEEDEIGILFMREGHQIQFPQDIEVFYVAPPALDEIGRWLRDRQPEREEE